MNHPFDDARLSVERALENVHEFETRLQSFMAGEPWSIIAEPKFGGSEYAHKLRFGEGIDRRIKMPVVEALRHLRSCLDLLTASCARLNGAPRISGLHFPFLDNPSAWRKVIKGRCRFVPHPVIDFFWTLSPYPGGDDELCALAKARNNNDHWALSDIQLSVSAIAVSRPGHQRIIEFPPWPDSGINEVELFTSPVREPHYTYSLPIEVAFKEGPPSFDTTPDWILRNLADKVTKIVDNTELIMRANYFPV